MLFHICTPLLLLMSDTSRDGSWSFLRGNIIHRCGGVSSPLYLLKIKWWSVDITFTRISSLFFTTPQPAALALKVMLFVVIYWWHQLPTHHLFIWAVTLFGHVLCCDVLTTLRLSTGTWQLPDNFHMGRQRCSSWNALLRVVRSSNLWCKVVFYCRGLMFVWGFARIVFIYVEYCIGCRAPPVGSSRQTSVSLCPITCCEHSTV